MEAIHGSVRKKTEVILHYSQSLIHHLLFEKHPSETIILTIKPDDGSTVGMEHAVAEFVKNNKDKVYTEGDIPSMKEARGKIVLIRRFKLTQNYEAWQTRAMGLILPIGMM